MIRLNMSGHPNPLLQAQGFVDLHLQVDLTDPTLPARLTDVLRQHIGDDPDVLLAPPGLAPLAAMVIAVTHGLTGQFPRLQPLVRNPDGWVPGPIIDLRDVRDGARQARPGMIQL